MVTGTLRRILSDDQGTLGVLTVGDFTCFMMELPWRDNMRKMSCIPAGLYELQIVQSPRFGKSYWFRQVPGRSEVLIHSGAWAGDTTKGWKTHSQGCLLPGKYHGVWEHEPGGKKQRAVMVSKPTVLAMHDYLESKPWKLEILDVYRDTGANR